MKLTWYGHSAFAVEFDDNRILIDPFVENGVWAGGWEKVAKGVTHVLLTHGHSDHFGSSVDILKKTGAMAVANFEICNYLVGQGIGEDKINPGNHGGTLDCGGFTVSFVNAVHSSSIPTDDGGNVYLGNPAGLVIHSSGDKSLYHMGDTDIFSDMALIQELHEPRIGIVPIGDRFTMGGALAALACRRYFKFSHIIPCHYGTFPILDPDAEKFLKAMEGVARKVTVPTVGEPFEL